MEVAKCSGIAHSPGSKQREGSEKLKKEKWGKNAIGCLEIYLSRKNSGALK